MTKEEIANLKKTAEAHKTLSEGTAEEKAEKVEEITKEMIKEEKTAEESKEDKKKVEAPKEKRRRPGELTREEIISAWEPITKLGREVKNGEIKSIDEIFEQNKKVLEEQIVDTLINVKTDLILIGQAKGKFGGGKRRAWRQTQRKTKEGNVPTFSTMAVAGDGKGHVGIGTGKSKETLPARDKAIRKAKLNLIQVKRTCAAFDCACSEPHTIPFEVIGKAGSVRVKLIPAPQGTGLVVANELKKVLAFAGIEDVYSKTFGSQRTTFNLVQACFDALKQTMREK